MDEIPLAPFVKGGIFGLVAMAVLMFFSAPAAAESGDDTACTGGQFQPCDNSDQCAGYPSAVLCIDDDFFDSEPGKCQIPCQDEDGNPVPSDCTIGETCVPGTSEDGDAFYCKRSGFVMDLNLLDTCIKHFVDNLIPPDVSRENECSLTSNLNQMLDQDGDGKFDIFDVDGCINAFLDIKEVPCGCSDMGDDGAATVYAQYTDTYCIEDEDCEELGGVCDLNQAVCKIEPRQLRRSQPCKENGDCPLIDDVCDPELKVCRRWCETHGDCDDPNLSCDFDTGYCFCDRPECPNTAPDTGANIPARVFCLRDEECGDGLFCDEALHFCRRECGFVVNRASSSGTEVLERTCFGNLKYCNPFRGRCERIDPSELTCVVDTDCPSGAYCFLGECAPKCYTSIDCPDSKWYCSNTNTCQPVPKETDAEAETAFDPRDYSLLFADRKVTLNTINDDYDIPLLIMNKASRKQVFDDPTVIFGYRLETTYTKKQSKICLKDYDTLFEDETAACNALLSDDEKKSCLADVADQRNAVMLDCEVTPDKEWLTLLSPFGTVYGDGDPSIDVKLNYAAVDLLSPGLYMMKLKAIFNNGQSDEITIKFNKQSPNGDYVGSVTVYKGGTENRLAEDVLKMSLFIDMDAPPVEWDRDILAPNNILVEREYIDVTSGFPVTGYLDGNASIIFDNPKARTRKENEKIPVKGLYSPDLGRMRLVTVIDFSDDETDCRSEDGDCDPDDPHQLKVNNIFDRKIRRLIEFLGTFNYNLGRYEGGYRETLSGIAPSHHDITLEGDFSMELVKQEDERIEVPKLVPDRVDKDGNVLPPVSVGFVDRFELVDMLSAVTGKCAQWETFQTPEAFDEYLKGYSGINYYQNMIRFEGEVGRALTELGNNSEDYLTLAEYLKGTIEFCPDSADDIEGEPPEDVIRRGVGLETDTDFEFEEDDYSDGLTCINREKVACGLAYYRKVLLAMRSPNPEGRNEECSIDAQCPGNMACDVGRCVCIENDDCPLAMSCVEGACVCSSSSQCDMDGADVGRDLVCTRGTCGCTANYQCLDTEVCRNGACVCASDAACDDEGGEPKICDLETGACVCGNGEVCGVGAFCQGTGEDAWCASCTDGGGECGDYRACYSGECGCDPLYPEESCGEGWLCRQGECLCDADTPNACGDGRTCEDGVCLCDGDEGCGVSEFCNPDARVCQGLDQGWVDLNSVGQSAYYNSYTLFCPEIALEGSDCLIPPEDNPALYALHEHNRFFKEMVQTLSYQAGNALSDAFYVMYKAAQGDDLDADSAYEYKELKLYDALANYEDLRSELFGPVNTAVMFEWPMRWFATIGDSLLSYMHTAANDRLETMSDLLDLRRRILRDTDEQDYVFVHHVLHEDYLSRVFLFVLQEQWQSELFMYRGESQEALEAGRDLLNRVNEMRNPLGLHPNRVYFENSDISLNNWQNYRNRTEADLQKAEESVTAAIAEMKNALRDRDNLETALQTAAHQFDATIEQMCGPASWYPDECEVTTEERAAAWTCDPRTSETECPQWTCEEAEGYEDRCETVYKSFDEALGNVDDETPHDSYECRVNSEAYPIETNNEQRLCVRGEMGSLLQEEISLKQQIQQVYNEVEMLSRQIKRETTYLQETQNANEELATYLSEQQDLIDDSMDDLRTQQVIWDTLSSSVSAVSCSIIFGLAAGGDCITSVIGAALNAVIIAEKNVIEGDIQEDIEEYQRLMSETTRDTADDKEIRQLRLQLDNMTAQWQNYLLQYQSVSQQLFNTQLRIQDTYYLAKRTAARYNDTVGSIVDHLIGRESGSVLLRNQMVQEAGERFRSTLEEAYKTAQAFTFRYNYGDQVTTTANRVFALQTTDDIRDFLEDLTLLERDYCGEQGLDCDYKNNQKVFRMSMRETLFPQYRDIISNGKILTAGEQFHNTITSSLFAVKRNRATGVKRQIELPINIWVNRGGGAAGEDGYMVNPEECNHFIVGQRNGSASASGTIAVNVIGTRLGQPVEYELWRNNTDYVRACKKGGLDTEYPTNVYTVGWAPQNQNADLDSPDTFLTHSQTFTACYNNWNLENPNTMNQEDTCYNFFARDRSLGTQDMTLVLPAVSDRQSWLLGDGVPDDEKPIIEDIILYFRYNSEPISSDGT